MLREARTLITEERYEKALAKLEKVITSDEDNADAWNLVGFSYRKLERYEPAMEGYARALAIDPRHTEAIEYLGELYLALDDLAQAEEQLARLGEICGPDCEEYEELKEAVEEYKAARGGMTSALRAGRAVLGSAGIRARARFGLARLLRPGAAGQGSGVDWRPCSALAPAGRGARVPTQSLPPARESVGALGLPKGLVDVPEDVVDGLEADRDADHVRGHPGRDLLFLVELPVGRRGGMDDEGARVADVREVAHELSRFDELDPASCPPSMPKVRMALAPRGTYFCARS